MSKNYTELLKHIIDECYFIQEAVSPEITKEEFFDNEVLKRAVVRSL